MEVGLKKIWVIFPPISRGFRDLGPPLLGDSPISFLNIDALKSWVHLGKEQLAVSEKCSAIIFSGTLHPRLPPKITLARAAVLSYTLHALIRQTNTTICKPFKNHAKCPQGILLREMKSDAFSPTRMGVSMKNMRKCMKQISHDLGCRSAVW
jgi:hypothetical protein